MKRLSLAAVSILAAAAVFAACGDDDDADDAEAVGDAYTEFTVALSTIGDVSTATDDDKDRLKDNCGEMDDALDVDGLGDFCDDLDEAVDDEDQVTFDAVKQQWSSLEPAVRTEIGAEIGDVAADDDNGDGNPLEGGSEDGDDDGNNGDENNN